MQTTSTTWEQKKIHTTVATVPIVTHKGNSLLEKQRKQVGDWYCLVTCLANILIKSSLMFLTSPMLYKEKNNCIIESDAWLFSRDLIPNMSCP